jgi:hypothetical protein
MDLVLYKSQCEWTRETIPCTVWWTQPTSFSVSTNVHLMYILSAMGSATVLLFVPALDIVGKGKKVANYVYSVTFISKKLRDLCYSDTFQDCLFPYCCHIVALPSFWQSFLVSLITALLSSLSCCGCPVLIVLWWLFSTRQNYLICSLLNR